MTPEQLSARRGRDVSRETFDRLTTLVALLEKWTRKINLVSRASLPDVWERHILDSIQVFDIAGQTAGRWADIGTGGGFPGLVVAILAQDETPGLDVILIESDLRKSAFLSAALRETGARAQVMAQRIEALDPLKADIISARALAPLTDLLEIASIHMAESGRALFPKGATAQEEIDAALETWRFTLHKHQSRTDDRAVILEIEGISRV